MATQQYQREISFISKVFNTEKNEWEEGGVKKTATFQELSRTEKKQHKLHFLIAAFFSSGAKTEENEGSASKASFDSDAAYDLIVQGIKTLLVIDEQFTALDKEEFLNDSGAIATFGFWLMKEKIAPFFPVLMTT